MTGIYVITNKINGKKYVGQSKDIFERWRQHEQNFRLKLYNYVIYQAFEKYGFENFEFSILEETKIEDLDEREKYWIKTLHTYVKDPKCQGYNMTLGGEGNSSINIEEVWKLWDNGLSVSEIAEELGHDRSAIRKYLLNYDNYSKEESNTRGDLIQGKNRWENVEQYTLQGEYLNTYYNMGEAQRRTGVSSKAIWCAIHGKAYTAGGYQWKFVSDEREIKDISSKTIKQKQPVIQINKDGTFNTYESAAEASRQTGIAARQIRKVCQKKANTAGGFKWYYKGDDDFERQDNFS